MEPRRVNEKSTKGTICDHRIAKATQTVLDDDELNEAGALNITETMQWN